MKKKKKTLLGIQGGKKDCANCTILVFQTLYCVWMAIDQL